MSVGTLVSTRRRPSWREARIALLFVLPCLVLFVLFRFGPTLAGGVLAFTDYTIGADTSFVGLENLRRLSEDPLFWRALRTTLTIAVLAVPLSIGISLGMALLVRRAFRGHRLFRSIFFLPVITSLVLAGIVFSWIFSSGGPWSSIMGWLGLPDQAWLSDTTLVIPAIVIVAVWGRFGFGMLILLARLQDVPRELEEAALADGANAWQRFRYIVLPELYPALFFLVVIETTFTFQIFDTVYVMTSGGPANSSYVLVFQLYDQAFRYFDFGYASAIGLALFVMTFIVAMIQRMTIGRER
ncbi:sugar ABC transporter permease [Phytoactinopolyspora alkaliphila]|uniref:Sugar ABC transporter permease n=1 Tax=Phytoactinopolyspora alkaliphila TaxID=1783498 RepID=A0A6N9YKR9_9ACTN|nr:sugar ABC transporter permease [Phytoactinopolyspora alkaliphila]